MAKLLRCLGLVVLSVMAGSAAGTTATLPQITPAEYLAGQPQSSFWKDHTLPPLTRFGWTLPFDARVELARRWGYALEFGGYVRLQEVKAKLADPNSVESRLCALATAQPETFKLAVILDRDFPKPVPDEFWVRDEQGNFTDGKNTWQDPAQSKFGKIASPEAPDAYWQHVAEAWAAPLAIIRQRAPIAVILNGGEYAMGVAGAQARQWELDPRVRAARGNRSWFEYASDRKGHQEAIVAKAVREAVPDRELYIYYNTSSESHRRRYDGWEQWAYEFPNGDAGVRVLARKLRATDRWLITARAAAGEECEVTVDIPLLGQVALYACPGGSVYEAVRDPDKPKLKRVDVASTDRRQMSSCAD